MRIIKPLPITDLNLMSSNVPETDWPVWDNATMYVITDTVMIDHIVYRAAEANTNKDPRLVENRVTWPILGMTNRWKMFDMTRGSEIQTTNPDSIEVTIEMSGLYSSLALFGVSAENVRVEIIDGSNGVVYDHTFSLSTVSGITYYFQWFYMPPARKSQFVTTDLPYYPGADIRITISSPGNTVKVGKLVLGYAKELGCTAYGTNVRFIDFSRRDRDDFGNLVTVPRRKISERTFQVKVDSDKLAQVEETIKGLDTTPTVFVGSPNHQVTIIFGLAVDFNSDYAFKKTNYSLKVQEF